MSEFWPESWPEVRHVCLVVALLLLGTASTASAACQSITLFAASSTAEAVEAVAKVYEEEQGCSVSTIFAGSATLARQIANGAPADIFLSANDGWMDWLQKQNLLYRDSRTALLGNTLAVLGTGQAYQTGTSLTPQQLTQLLSGGKWAMADANSVPAGIYARQALTRMGLWRKLNANAVQSTSVRRALAWLQRGEINVAVGYTSDARALRGVHVLGLFPRSSHSPIVYPIALLGRTPSPSARTFYRHLKSFQAAVVFADHGFRRLEANK